jgi:hypothetical protein
MRSTLFPGTGEIAVVQKLHPAPSVIFLEGELIKEPVAVVTVHGLLEWSYPSHAKVEAQVRPFVRTLSLVPRQDSPLGWLIATDSLLLANPPKLPAGSVNAGVLCDTDSMVFDALGSSRVDRFARKCGVTTEMAGVAASFCRTDAQLTDVLTDLSYTSTSLLEQCHAVANGEPRAAMAVAWVSNKLSIPPAAAAQRLLEADKGDGDYFALAAAVIETALAHSS